MKVYASEHYLLIGLNIFLLFLVTLNFWQILVRQKKYKTLPLLFFYIFALIAIVLRLVYSVFTWSQNYIYLSVDYVYIAAKLCVGLLQTWMIFEIAIRIKHLLAIQRNLESSTPNVENWMRFGQCSTIFITLVGFVTFSTFVIISAHKEGNNNRAFEQKTDEAFAIIGYSYLLLFVIMAAVNVLLVIQIRAKERSAAGSDAPQSFYREKRNLSIILFFFELSYLVRFLWDKFISPALYDANAPLFYYALLYDLMAYAEGLAFMVLLLQHSCNFRMKNMPAACLDTSSQFSSSVNNNRETAAQLFVSLDQDTSLSKSTARSCITQDEDGTTRREEENQSQIRPGSLC